jgi:hypothetical protein
MLSGEFEKLNIFRLAEILVSEKALVNRLSERRAWPRINAGDCFFQIGFWSLFATHLHQTNGR